MKLATEYRVVTVSRPSQCTVDAETGEIVIEPNGSGDRVIIEFANTDCIEEFVSNALDALSCWHAAQLRERTYQVMESR